MAATQANPQPQLVKILLTGASGQLGRELLPLLADHEVVAPNRATLDITNRRQVSAALLGIKPDAVINCAAMTQVDACETQQEKAFATNAHALEHLAQGCTQIGAHLTTISTDHVFDGRQKTPYVETDPLSPVSVYGQSKAAGERAVTSDATIVRTSWLCGEFGTNIVKTILRKLAEQAPLVFVTDQIGQPTLTSDLAAIVRDLTFERSSGVFHATNQGIVSWFEFAQIVAQLAGANPQWVQPCNTPELQPPQKAPRPQNAVLKNVALGNAGYAPTRDFREPLAEVIERLC